MSNPRTFFNHKKEDNDGQQTAEKTAVTDVVLPVDKIITREDYETQLEEAKAMAFGI